MTGARKHKRPRVPQTFWVCLERQFCVEHFQAHIYRVSWTLMRYEEIRRLSGISPAYKAGSWLIFRALHVYAIYLLPCHIKSSVTGVSSVSSSLHIPEFYVFSSCIRSPIASKRSHQLREKTSLRKQGNKEDIAMWKSTNYGVAHTREKNRLFCSLFLCLFWAGTILSTASKI